MELVQQVKCTDCRWKLRDASMVSRVRLETVRTGSLHPPDFQGAVKVNASDKKKLTPKRGALGR